ncbi:SDR family NAD(P)-dependent oxidoreductase [Streptomyces sp. NPDC048254]|uniref:type I polyketide synthase n=1 Tax=Streptomyces sp. NPDC048254 TaxID=3365525 RepID=UPI00372039EB
MSMERIAVVGIGARVPDADDVEQFWANLLARRNSIHRLTREQLLEAGEDAAVIDAPNYIPVRPLMNDPWGFDNSYFEMPERESLLRNPQHRLFLELCSTALQTAGVDPGRFDGSIGVYGGCASDRFVEDHIRANPELMAQVGEMIALVSNNIDYLASFVSYKLGLRGPSVAVRTACSTSLVAVHLACQALRAGDCDLALAGGVEIETPYGRGYLHVEGGIETRDGVCRPLDADASGTVFGSGGGVVALKRLSDAQADGDPILAVILGTAVNNDGAERAGFTAPSWEGQSLAVAEAITVAGVDPSSISYVELHGTGTKVGDPIEIRGLHEGMRLATGRELEPGTCAIGSVKSNLGHLGPASGVVGLIKTVLSLGHETIAPTINVNRVNPDLKLELTPFVPAIEARPWPRVPGTPRRAGVSSFGFGGTNAHAVLEEAPTAPGVPCETSGPQLLTWSGVDEAAREQMGARLLRVAAGSGAEGLAGAARASRAGRKGLRYRAALRADDSAALRRMLESGQGTVLGDGQRRRAVLMFPGQGSQYPAMGVAAQSPLPGFGPLVRSLLGDFGGILGVDLVRVWEDEADRSVLARTVHAQPLLYAVGLAAARALAELGLEPAAVLGHSVGEFVAATVAGVFTEHDAVRIIAERARLMQAMPTGAMLAVSAPQTAISALAHGKVWLSARNAVDQTVLGGAVDAVEAVERELEREGLKYRRLATSHAFHTPMVDEAVAPLEAALAGTRLRAPDLPLISTVTGRELTDEQAVDPSYWARQLAEPVLLADAFGNVPVTDALLIECGPGSSLTGLARRHTALAAQGARAVSLLPDRPGHHVLDSLGEIWCQGADIDLGRLPGTDEVRRLPLPAYPYRRTRFLLPDASRAAAAAVPSSATPTAPEASAAAADTRSGPTSPDDAQPVIALPVWEPAGILTPVQPGSVRRGKAVVLMPADRAAAALVRTSLQHAGYRVVPVVVGTESRTGGHGATVRPGDPEDLQAALDRLLDDSVDLLVHAFGCGAQDALDPEHAQHALLSVLQVHRHVARRPRQEPRLLVLSQGAVQLTAAEPVVPARAAAAAVVRSAVLESGAGRSRLIDFAAGDASLLAREIGSEPAEPVLAVRGNMVWRPGRRVLPLPTDATPLLQPGGRYVITGGLGGVGLAVAEALADTGLLPHLVLVSRNAEHGELDPETDDQLTRIEQAGATVDLERADVTDPERVGELFARIAEEYGPVDGIFHAAGVPGGAILANRTLADAARVLAPKVGGALALREVALATPSIRFLSLFSSRAALNGLVGSADYAAANAFMDALAHVPGGDGRTVVTSVNWPTWFGVGMAAPDAGKRVWRSRIEPEDWVVAEHRLDEVPLLPATGIIELLVRAVRALCAGDGDPIEFTALTLVGPLTVERATEVEVTLTEEGAGFQVNMRSWPDGEGDAARLHVTGKVRCTDVATAARLDLAARTEGWSAVEPSAVEGSRFRFGPRFDVIAERWRGADPDETVGLLELPEDFEQDLMVHELHPALLDRALALQLRPGDHIPFAYKRITVHHDLPERVFARHSLRPETDGRSVVDAVVCDARGRVLVEIEGFAKIRLTASDRDERAATTAVSRPAPRVGLTTGVNRDQAVAALLALLHVGMGPRAVVVPAREWAEEDGVQAESVPRARVATASTAAAESAVSAAATAPAPAGIRAGASRDELIDTIIKVWAETLGTPGLDAGSDFFAVGGDSLVAIQLVSRLQDRLGVELSVSDLFESPTVGALAEAIGGRA